MDDDQGDGYREALTELHDRADAEPEFVSTEAQRLINVNLGDEPTPANEAEAVFLMNAAGALIDAAGRLRAIDLLERGEALMAAVVHSGHLTTAGTTTNALYNLANSRIGIADLRWSQAVTTAPDKDRVTASASIRWAEHERLKRARREFADAAAQTTDSRRAAMMLCNLANTLDHSGRWLEAYDTYVRALTSDPTNGAAAGNAALLIRKVMRNGWSSSGDLCALYNHYVRLAREHRDRTLEVAGTRAAQVFDELKPLECPTPDPADTSPTDPYQAWVTTNRLALAPALEGLTANDRGRWDTSRLRSVTSPIEDADTPPILDILNILKADFLVARRLVFEAMKMVDETAGGWAQHPSDPGVYTNTLNYAVAGEVSAKLVLAHRAALDMLDKTAVAANEHLGIGDNPTKIWFRSFWSEDHQTRLRCALVNHEGLQTAVLSMAELALDMYDDGMYAHAKDIRDAGTHRFVRVHLGIHDPGSTAAMEAIGLDDMLTTTIEALTVARSAYLYLVAMLTVYEARRHDPASRSVEIPLPDMD